ncbi:uncharacterized protein OCT59_022591 [Rhizophagus irregularis]|uniref:uncharacterized protein n=1 Tax=Rhizophagus irregularis TaxID=588596 RepID=UPI003326C14E|nr:hypothetical protein OCT59_022591 [Rhizophagus irregularis]
MDNEEFETKKDIEIIIPPEAEDKAEKFIENDDAKDHMKAIDEIEKYVKTTDDTKEHMKHRKSIDYIFVSQYMYDTDNEEYDPTLDAYVVTFSKNDNSILGWRVNVEKGEQPPDNVYFQHDRLKELDKIESFILCKKILVLFYRTKGNDRSHFIIDLNNNRASDRFLKLKNDYVNYVNENSIGFLPNGDLIQAKVYNNRNNCKIYKYCFTNKPNNTASREYSQIYDIEDLENLKKCTHIKCNICRTKLFLFVKQKNKSLILQFDLLTMTLDRQYIFNCKIALGIPTTVINKSQTLCAITMSNYVCIFSMESGVLISEFHDDEFITLKNGFEGLIIKSGSDKKYRLIDPYQLFDTIETNESIDDKNVITQLNRKVSIRNNNVCITDITGLDENLVQQTKTSFYTLSTFIFIQKMLKDIIKEVIKDVPKSEIEIKDGTRVVLESNHIIKIEHNGVTSVYKTNSYILSLNLLYNQYLVQIDTSGIRILNDFGKPTLSCRYYWYNDEWNEKFENSLNNKNDIKFINDYIPFIKKVLANEFNDSKSSIPCSRFFVSRKQIDTFRYDFKGIINDTLALSKFGSEILNIAINDRNDDIVQHILDQTFESIKNNHNYMASLPFVSLNLPKLCNCPDFLIKFITRTSFLLSPACNAIKRSTNTSLYSHLSIRIKKPSLGNDYFKSISSFFKSLIQNLRIQEEVQTISFIVPFPQICVYQNHKNHKTENKHTKSSRGIKHNDDETENNQDTKEEKDHKTENNHSTKNGPNNIWNEFLYKQKSVLFCNIDSNHFYNWWNFAAIIDYKWKTFGWIYYYLIWMFYTIFYIFYALASTLDHNFISNFYRGLLFIISILLGFIHLYFEFQQCLWKTKEYFNDLWNLFDVGAYLLPIIVSTEVNDDNDPRNLATKYYLANSNEITNNTITLVQPPDSNTNLFNWFPTSLLAVYKLITGDSGSLSPWTYPIDDYNNEEEFLLQKAKIIVEIELFYMLSSQKYNKNWFPDWIYYDIPVTEVRKLINAINNNKTEFDYFPFISKELKELVAINDEIREENSKENKTKNEIKEELKQMKKILNDMIKSLNIDKDKIKEDNNGVIEKINS